MTSSTTMAASSATEPVRPRATTGPHMVEGGLTRSITDEFSGNDGVHINRWNGASCSLTELMKTGSGTRITQTIADILGDWREELVIALPNEVRVYTTTIPASNRLYTLMHNPLYRLNVGQSAQRNFGTSLPDYYLGTGMSTPPGARHQVRRPAPLESGLLLEPQRINGPGAEPMRRDGPILPRASAAAAAAQHRCRDEGSE